MGCVFDEQQKYYRLNAESKYLTVYILYKLFAVS
jgi:hypothetical protein